MEKLQLELDRFSSDLRSFEIRFECKKRFAAPYGLGWLFFVLAADFYTLCLPHAARLNKKRSIS